MTTLTQTAITTRKIIRYGIFFVIFLMVGKVMLDIGIRAYRKIFPAPPPPPTVTYGKLPKLPFPDQTKPNLFFTLETPEGGLPKITGQAKVYLMPKISSSLLALDSAKERASSLGFSPFEQKVSETIYRFQNKVSPATLEMNIVTGIFSISYDLKVDSSPISRKPPAPEISASLARSYLSSANLLPSDLTGPTSSEFLKLESDKFVPTLSLSDSNLIKVSFFRKNYDNFSSLTANPKQANVWLMISGASEREKQIVAAEFHYFSVDESQFSTYPLKTSEKVWEEFNSGKYYLASLGTNKEGDNIKIRRVYLAYYDPGVVADFFQPIVVFEGDKDFKGYIPAVTSDYYGE
jgi:hypothetical protein